MYNALTNIKPTILAVLKELKNNGFKLILASNADSIDIQFWDKSPLFNLFDNTYFSCNISLAKPDVNFYKKITSDLNILPKDCLYIGDGGDNELLGASQAGMDTVWAKHIYNRKQLNNMDKVTYEIEKFDQLNNLINNN